MPKEKPLGEKNDFYSNKRKALMDVKKGMAEGLDDNSIMYKLMIRYGFGKNIFLNLKEIVGGKND